MTIDGFLWVVNGVACLMAFLGGLNLFKNNTASVIAFALAGVFMLLSFDISKGFWLSIGIGT